MDNGPESSEQQQEPQQLQSYGRRPSVRSNTSQQQMLSASGSSRELSWASQQQQQQQGLPAADEEASGRGIQSLQQVSINQRHNGSQVCHGPLAVIPSGLSSTSQASEECFNRPLSPTKSGDLGPDLEFRMDERMPDHEKQKQKLRHRGQENNQVSSIRLFGGSNGAGINNQESSHLC